MNFIYTKTMLHGINARVDMNDTDSSVNGCDHAVVYLSCQPRHPKEFLSVGVDARKRIESARFANASEDLGMDITLYFTPKEAEALVHALTDLVNGAIWQMEHPAPAVILNNEEEDE